MTKEKLEDLIKMLKEDINVFGPAGDDLSRLANYKEQLKNLKTP